MARAKRCSLLPPHPGVGEGGRPCGGTAGLPAPASLITLPEPSTLRGSRSPGAPTLSSSQSWGPSLQGPLRGCGAGPQIPLSGGGSQTEHPE